LDQNQLMGLLERVRVARHDRPRSRCTGGGGRPALSAAGARVIGVNARNLATLEVTAASSNASRPACPNTVGEDRRSRAYRGPHDLIRYAAAGADAVLVGEGLVTQKSRATRSPKLVTAGSTPATPRGAMTSTADAALSSVTGLVTGRDRHFGRYGGRFVPEALIAALDELDAAYRHARADEAFQAEFGRLLRDYAGCRACSTTPPGCRKVGARILLKREDLNHTGAHKVRNVLGQALLTKRMGKPG
jgi:tryptophan synthase beta chain